MVQEPKALKEHREAVMRAATRMWREGQKTLRKGVNFMIPQLVPRLPDVDKDEKA